MVTYKQHLFVSLIEEFTLNESFSYPGKVNFLELLLEAPMDDATAEKIVSNKKRVNTTVYVDKPPEFIKDRLIKSNAKDNLLENSLI